jgi:protein-arginine kinase activator protein McsA
MPCPWRFVTKTKCPNCPLDFGIADDEARAIEKSLGFLDVLLSLEKILYKRKKKCKKSSSLCPEKCFLTFRTFLSPFFLGEVAVKIEGGIEDAVTW